MTLTSKFSWGLPSRPKTRPGLEDLLPRWCLHVTTGRRPQFLTTWPFRGTAGIATQHGNRLSERSILEEGGDPGLFYPNLACASHHHFYHILLVRSESLSPMPLLWGKKFSSTF